jgi:DegV family protein with EDD domain
VTKKTPASTPRKPLVRVVTDSSARIPLTWAAEHNVTVLPHYVTLGGKTFREDVDLSDSDLAARISATGQPFSVAAPTVDDLTAVYRKLADAKADVISLHVSNAMSRTFRNAIAAREDVSGRCDVHLFDTRTMAMGLHMLVRSAVEMAESGLPAEQIVKRLRGLMQGIYGIFISDDMPFLQNSGRLRPAQAYLGKMLEVIPCLSIEEGDLVAVEKVRSPDRAIEKLAEFASEFEPEAGYAILQLSPAPNERSRELVEALRPLLPGADRMPLMSCGALVGHIIGLRGLGVMIFEGDNQSL